MYFTPHLGRVRYLLVVASAMAACGPAQDIQLGGSRATISSGGNGAGGAVSTNTGGSEGGALAVDPTTSDICTESGVDESRLLLLAEASGFGRETTGGELGCLVVVSNSADSGPGTLREALESGTPAWIVFAVNELELTSDINVRSDKTIDGRGGDTLIKNYGLRIGPGVSNVIVHGIEFVGTANDTGTGGSAALEASDDAIVISGGASKIWIDHCNFSAYSDGLIDILEGSTDITVSYCHFFNHRKVMLVGNENGGVEDQNTRVTLHHNWFETTESYHPRLRQGWVHSYNNYLQAWGSFGSGASENGQLASESNAYEAGSDLNALVSQIADDIEPGLIRSTGDVAINGAILIEREPALVFNPSDYYDYEADVAGSDLIETILSEVGPR